MAEIPEYLIFLQRRNLFLIANVDRLIHSMVIRHEIQNVEGIGRPGRPFSTHFNVFSTHLGSVSAYLRMFYIENVTPKVPKTPKSVFWRVAGPYQA